MQLMQLNREFFDPSLIATAVAWLTSHVVVLATSLGPHKWRATWLPPRVVHWICVSALSAAIGFVATGEPHGSVFAGAMIFFASVAVGWPLQRLHGAGSMIAALPVITVPLMSAWSYLLFEELGFPSWWLWIVVGVAATAMLLLPVIFLVKLAATSMMTHSSFQRPVEPLPPRPKGGPFVSIHVPCFAEPHDVVIRTMESLTRLNYDNYEVIVCDNNTKDASLWLPLPEACERLNERMKRPLFRFYHVDPITGAKAGALNFCLTETSPEATLIASIDADYTSDPDFLSTLVGFFDEDRIGFVQTSHDYRDQEESLFKKILYCEYLKPYKYTNPSVNEYDGSFPVGTMLLLRRDALERAGGWSEWCLTEDSEVGFRIHHEGYEGVFLHHTLGRGLIPDRWEDFRRQRFRWVAGPLQAFRRYWRYYIPTWLGGKETKMNSWFRLLEIYHVYYSMKEVASPIMIVFVILFAVLTIILGLPQIVIPDTAWTSIYIMIATGFLQKWIEHRLAGYTTLQEFVLGSIGRCSLKVCRCEGTYSGFLSGRPLTWHRTPKFRSTDGAWTRAIRKAPRETLAAVTSTVGAFCPFFVRSAIGKQIAAVISAYLACIAVQMWCAPFIALVAENEVKKSDRMGGVRDGGDMSKITVGTGHVPEFREVETMDMEVVAEDDSDEDSADRGGGGGRHLRHVSSQLSAMSAPQSRSSSSDDCFMDDATPPRADGPLGNQGPVLTDIELGQDIAPSLKLAERFSSFPHSSSMPSMHAPPDLAAMRREAHSSMRAVPVAVSRRG